MKVASAIKLLRRRLNLTQSALAQRVGVTTRAVQYYERGDRAPEVAPLAALASLAAEAGESALAEVLTVALVRALDLHARERTIASFDRSGRDALPSATLLITRHGAEEARYLAAVLDAFLWLRSDDPQLRARAHTALEQLAIAMEGKS